MRLFFLFLLLGFFLKPDPVLAKPVGKASFLASTNAGFDVKGEGATVEGTEIVKKDGKVSGNFTVVLKDLKTGMDLRDSHMRDTLETEKFPKAVFKLTPTPWQGKQAIGGILELHGEQKPFYGSASFSSPTNVVVKGKVKLEDFGIKAPNYKLVRLEDIVEVTIEISGL